MIEKLKKLNLFCVINSFARWFIEFLIAFVWIRYFVGELWICLLCSIICVAVIETCLYLINTKRHRAKNTKKSEQKTIDDIATTFLFSDDKENLTFFHKLASKKHSATQKSKYIVINNPNKKVILLPFFTYNNFSCDNLLYCLNIIRKDNPKKLVICSTQIDPQAQRLARHFQEFEIVLLDKFDTYHKLLSYYDCYPEIKHTLKTTPPSKRELLRMSLNKKRAKGYFLSSVVLLLSSFIVRSNIYYVIFSSILLILSLVSYSNPKFNPPSSESIFD